MNFKEVKKLLIDRATVFFDKAGFSASDTNSGLYFYQSADNEVNYIFFSLSDYGEKHVLYPPGAGKRFNLVEEIFWEVFDKPGYDTENSITISMDNYNGSMDDELPGALDYVSNEYEVKETFDKIKPYIEEFILPFFEAYPSLVQVDKKLSNLNDEERLKFLPGSEGKSSLKHMIIAKLAGNPDYEAVEKKVGSSFEKVAQKVKRLSFLPELHQKLKAKLESIDPVT